MLHDTDREGSRVEGSDTERRFLIATAVANHRHEPGWNRPGLAAAREEIIDLFTGPMGYEHISELGLDPTREQLTTRLREFCRSPERRPTDLLTVYIACHGEVLEGSEEHVLLTADTDPEDIADALPTAELARKMLLGTRVRRVLLMLDTCYSGRGGNELTAAALTRMTHSWERTSGSGLAVVTSAQPAEQARTGAFPHLLRRAVDGLPTAGHAPSTLAVDAVVSAMNADSERPGFQTISASLSLLTGGVPPFLPNPRHRSRPTEVDLAIRQAGEWEAQDERRAVEYRTRLLTRAMGSQGPARGWWFLGRHAALTDITRWLANPDPGRPLLAVTAAPGSGKTAVLGLIAALVDPDRRATVPLHALGLPPAAVPPAGAADVALYAQGLTTDQVLRGISAAARTDADTPGSLLEALSGRSVPLTVLIDALDEAGDPEHLVRRLLRPLVDHACGRLRLLVGTRPHLLKDLGLQRESSIDLDAPRYADLDALTGYAARGLLDSAADSPYRRQPAPALRAVARAVAEASEPSFLVARITSGTLAADPAVPDPRDPVWRRSLPRLPSDAMRQDLEARLGPDAARVRDLLLPLAFAEGQGLPWEDIWALLASRIAGVSYTDDDLLRLRRRAGSYVVEAPAAGRSAYRLYHQALAEHLRDGADEATVHRAFTRVLLARVPPGLDGARDWTRAHPYALRHLATHAGRCGLLDDLLMDDGYLVHAEPDELLLALRDVHTDEGRLTAAVYRASATVHRPLSPRRRRHVLATDAARFAAGRLCAALAEPLEWRPRWATGQQTSPALYASVPGDEGSMNTVARTTIDGRPMAVVGGHDDAVRVWDLATGALHTTLHGHGFGASAVACASVDGAPVAVVGCDKQALVWDLADGTLRATLTGDDWHLFAVACATVDGRAVAVTSSGRALRVWDLATGALRATLSGRDTWVQAVACTTVGGRPMAVTVSDEDVARVWDLTTHTLHIDFPVASADDQDDGEHMRSVACATVDGRPVAVIAKDLAVRVWDLATGAPRATLTGHSGEVSSVACTEVDGRPVAVTAAHDGVRVWDLTSGALYAAFVAALDGEGDSVEALACATVDGRPVAVTTSGNAMLRVWDLAGAAGGNMPDDGHTDDIAEVACGIVDSGAVAVTAGRDAAVHVWDLATGTLRTTLAGHRGPLRAVACATVQGRPLAITAGWERTVRVWDLTTGALRATLTGHTDTVDAVVCTTVDDRPVAVTAGRDAVRVWDLTAFTPRMTLPHEGARSATLACTTVDGRPVAVVGDHTRLRVWDLTTGDLRTTVSGLAQGLDAVACASVDGRPVAVTAGRDPVRVWDLTTGDVRATLGQSWVVEVVCGVIDGRPVAITAGYDLTVRIFDLRTTAELAVFDGGGPVHRRLCMGPGQEVVIGTGRDVVVLERRARRGRGEDGDRLLGR
ncbi:caspase family protein [Streptomyces solisilvae]|uniref:caspase family protein n=1 Tax=Streptomyces malaysiensis TaxID=92644 RepID=UPI003691753D